ncbi:MAG TPA: L,D-transpeptidase [Methylocystis sp.]|nr:L,D-transpeptidase [Methylocystis sp.]
MIAITSRLTLAALVLAAASGLGACNTVLPRPTVVAAAPPPEPPPSPDVEPNLNSDIEPPIKTFGPSEFNYKAIYAEAQDGAFTVPAVKLSQVNPTFLRKNVAYATSEAPGTIVIDPANHFLYYVEGGGRATRYGVGVGREGFVWAGEATIRTKQEWPDWYPPKEMIARRPDLNGVMVQLQSGVGMHGGPSNPLGARAMYLWQGDKDTLFRIHGTNEPWTIGHSESSGCIRMINQDVMDLYDKTPAGAKVVVLGSPHAQALNLGPNPPAR